MAQDVQQIVAQNNSCVRNGSRHRNKRHLQHFPASRPLEFIAMDILEPLPETMQGNQYVVIITDRYSKLTRAIKTSKTAAAHMANIFLDHWIVSFDISSYLLTDNGTRFRSKFFASICGYLGVKHLTTTAYHPQTNGQA